MEANLSEIKALLDDRSKRYNNTDFIETDPIQIPHYFNRKEDIEIAGFLSATIAWGQRKSIIKNGFRLMEMMYNSPFEFIMESNDHEKKIVLNFVHRTLQQDTKLRKRVLEH